MAPQGQPSQFYFPPEQSSLQLHDSSLPIVITEGEKKTLSLHRLANYDSDSPRFIAIGISGVWNWRGIIGKVGGPNGDRLDEKGPIPDWNQIKWEGRDVYVCFDADWESNSSVRAARAQLFKLIKSLKANPRVFDVPSAAGIKGADEWIASEGPDAVLALWQKAMNDPAKLSGKFIISEDWVCHVEKDGETVQVCSELSVVKEARVYGSDEWWKYVCFKAPDGTEHKRLVSFGLLEKADGRECREFLSTLGLRIGTHKNSRTLLVRYLKESKETGIVYATNKTGWHDNNRQFVLPDQAEHITAFVEVRRAAGLETSTINRDLATLRRMLNLAEQWEVI
jgi:Domain of unknown function (DUF3854)/Domain of unknown function (DUF927)